MRWIGLAVVVLIAYSLYVAATSAAPTGRQPVAHLPILLSAPPTFTPTQTPTPEPTVTREPSPTLTPHPRSFLRIEPNYTVRRYTDTSSHVIVVAELTNEGQYDQKNVQMQASFYAANGDRLEVGTGGRNRRSYFPVGQTACWFDSFPHFEGWVTAEIEVTFATPVVSIDTVPLTVVSSSLRVRDRPDGSRSFRVEARFRNDHDQFVASDQWAALYGINPVTGQEQIIGCARPQYESGANPGDVISPIMDNNAVGGWEVTRHAVGAFGCFTDNVACSNVP